MRTGPSGKKFDEQWREIPDDTPIAVSVDLRPKSLEQMVAAYVGQAMALEARMRGEESGFDGEDLEVDEEGDDEILTPYELHAMAAEAERESRRRKWLRENITGRKDRPTNGDSNGSVKGDSRAGKPGQAGETVQGDGKPVAGAVAADRKEAPGVAQSGGVAGKSE